MKRNGFTLIELTVTFCLLAILSLGAVVIYNDRVAVAAESAAKGRLESVLAIQDSHRNTYGSFAKFDELPSGSGLTFVTAVPSAEEISVAVDAVSGSLGLAARAGRVCVTVTLEDDDQAAPVFATHDDATVNCNGSLGLVSQP
jgi:Tfp pilus assembly protein PilE